MAYLAIRGHKERGNEVIEILGMLGGGNLYGAMGNSENLLYFIHTNIIQFLNNDDLNLSNFIIFTLEEFLEKFPFKVWNKVQHKGATSCGTVYVIERMDWTNNHIEYAIRPLYDYNHTGLVTLCAEDLQPYKEETMDKVNKAVFDANAQCCDIMNRLIKEETMEDKGTLVQIDLTRELCVADEVEIILGDYEFVLKDGKTYFVKRKPQYPKTYEECVQILLERASVRNDIGYKGDLLIALQRLVVCRDAYWKIAGEQMGLDKPWEPDWSSGLNKQCIVNCENRITKTALASAHTILAFPTEEMRDAFYENFKELIELVKELL